MVESLNTMVEFSQLLPMILTRVANVMGYGELSVKQQEAIMEFITGRDIFDTLPISSGKSLCYCFLL